MRSGWNTAVTLATIASSTSYRAVHSFAFRSTAGRISPQEVFQRTTAMSFSLATEEATVQFVDIGANLLDERYTDGVYYGKKRHESDFDLVLERAIQQGVTHIILTAGTLQESRKAVSVVEAYRKKWEEETEGEPGGAPVFLGCTIGVHPTRCQQEFVDNVKDGPHESADSVLGELTDLLSKSYDGGYVVAIGEFGLDYDRLEFAPKEVQIEFFRRQLDSYLCGDHPKLGSLPLFLHNRSVGRDLLEILLEYKDKVHPETKEPVSIEGVVHSFDDSLELALAFIDLGLYIGLNGCSLKTEENLQAVKDIPLEHILLETDCPYCEIKATHASHKHVRTTFAGEKKVDKKFEAGKMVKGRNEPNHIIQVAEVIAGVKEISVEEVARACYQNSMDLYRGFSGTTK